MNIDPKYLQNEDHYGSLHRSFVLTLSTGLRGNYSVSFSFIAKLLNYYSVTKFFFYRKINIKHLFMKWKHSIQALLKKRQPAVLDNKVQFQSSFILNTYF